jgi:hypothetical protein
MSVDTLVDGLHPNLDAQFKQMLNELKLVESNKLFLQERKRLSHKAKRLDPNDVGRRADWPNQQNADYLSYKAKVGLIKEHRVKYEASEEASKRTKRADLATQENTRNQAIEHGHKWIKAALE